MKRFCNCNSEVVIRPYIPDTRDDMRVYTDKPCKQCGVYKWYSPFYENEQWDIIKAERNAVKVITAQSLQVSIENDYVTIKCENTSFTVNKKQAYWLVKALLDALIGEI